jgi:hypothetical protein
MKHGEQSPISYGPLWASFAALILCLLALVTFSATNAEVGSNDVAYNSALTPESVPDTNPSPTPTAVNVCVSGVGEAVCDPRGVYSGVFTITNQCPQTLRASQGGHIELAEQESGPWTNHGATVGFSSIDLPSGVTTRTVSIWHGWLPGHFNWFRINYRLSGSWGRLDMITPPERICGPTLMYTPTPTTCPIQYTDVPIESTFYPFIHCLACGGLVSGYACGGTGEPCDPGSNPYFRPRNNITRGQVAKLVSNAAGYHEDPREQLYEDVPPNSTFYPWVNRLSNRGIMGGYRCGMVPHEPCVPPKNRAYFRPSSQTTRGQAAAVVKRTFFYICPTP